MTKSPKNLYPLQVFIGPVPHDVYRVGTSQEMLMANVWQSQCTKLYNTLISEIDKPKRLAKKYLEIPKLYRVKTKQFTFEKTVISSTPRIDLRPLHLLQFHSIRWFNSVQVHLGTNRTHFLASPTTHHVFRSQCWDRTRAPSPGDAGRILVQGRKNE